MPFLRNTVTPKYLQQGKVASTEDDGTVLQDFTNLALVNVIKQLGTLHGQVDLIFGNLITQGEELNQRLTDLKGRLKTVEAKVEESKSNQTVKERGLGKDKKAICQKIADRTNFFQSEKHLESGLFLQSSAPPEVISLYEKAEPMPRLKDLDEYRTDGRMCAKFYSDPNLFYLAWQESLQQMIAEQHAKSIRAKRSVRLTNVRRVRKVKKSRISEAQKRKMGVELAANDTTQGDDDEEEFYSEEEWSDSDDDDEVLLQPNAGTSLQENIHARHNGTLTVRSNHYRLSSFGDYNLHDSERSLADAHSPPVFTVDDEFSILPADPTVDTEQYNFRFEIESASASKWDDSPANTVL